MKLLGQPLVTKESLVKDWRRWDADGRVEKMTPLLVVGMLYQRYRLRFGAFPITTIEDDVRNVEQFMRLYVADDPTLVLFVIEVMFNLKGFSNISTGCLLNKNILQGWGMIERALALRKKPKQGEQAEFQSDGEGTLYV